MEFVGGLLLGAVIGVVADRLWTKFERRPRFEITCSHTYGVAGDGLVFEVKNVGAAEIPPHKLCLYHPKRGSMSFFVSDSIGQPLLAGQSHKHTGTLIKHRQPINQWGEKGDADEFLTGWFLREFDYERQEGTVLEDPRYEGFLFRIVMDKSERILFESEMIGNAVAKEVVSAGKEKVVGKVGGYNHSMLLQYHPPTAIKHLLRRLKSFRNHVENKRGV